MSASLGLFDYVRGLRLQAVMARGLVNWREVWRAYSTGAVPPTLELRGGGTLEHGPEDSAGFLFLETWANRCYTRHLPRLHRGLIVDIGANIGLFSVYCLRRAPGVEVHAYEPAATSFTRLERNISANRLGARVRLFNEAVGRQSGIAYLRMGEGSATTSVTAAPSDTTHGASVAVRQVDLNTVLARAGRTVELLKIDAEGAEGDILEGVTPAALRAVRHLVAEYHEDRVPGVLDRARRALEDAGFAVRASCGRRCGPLLRARNLRP